MNQEIDRDIKSVKDITNIFVNFLPIFYKRKKKIGIFSLCAYRMEKDKGKNIYEKYLKIDEDKYLIKTLFKRGFKINIGKYSYFFNLYKCSINVENVISYPPQNLCAVIFSKNNSEEMIFPVVYNAIYYSKYLGKVGKIYNFSDRDLVCYFRQTNMNSIALTVREKNITDKFQERIKIFFAKLLSLITPKSNIILLYEKEVNKFEESAAMVYEKLIDKGYDNSYFIIRKDSKHNEFIKEKYRKNIIYAYTFKHYYSYFKCNKFIGSELVPHSIELRAANQYITKKMIKKKYKQVFLQHGVMYMIALDSKNRGGFRKGGNELPIDAKVVVSSKKEADHFVELGGFDYKDLYITGLPFYDRTIKKDNADKIVIMLTWRQWDYNALISDHKNASYYNMIKNIIDHIPEKYHDKLYLLPHPLILSKFKNLDLNKWIPNIISYDKILEETNLLITDYSSIAYSAFYRGSNVIFCWEELEECMKHHESHLMLNEDNTFGDISYSYDDLGKLIENNYLKKQSEKYKKRYKEIVEFNDNKNTERLIEFLKRDNFI